MVNRPLLRQILCFFIEILCVSKTNRNNFISKNTGNRPTLFPYSPPPQSQEPTRTLRALINIRKESLRFVKCKITEELNEEFSKKDAEVKQTVPDTKTSQPDKKEEKRSSKKSPKPAKDESKEGKDQLESPNNDKQTTTNYNPNTNYNIEFVFDTDVKVAITIYYFCYEEIKSDSVNYISKNLYVNSPTFYYDVGANQLFSQSMHVFNPSLYNESELVYRPLDEEGNFIVNNTFPMVIQCVSLEGDDPKQSHSLIATIERNHDKGYLLKPFKQKLFIDGLCYLLCEIYGIEKKKNPVNYNNLNYKPDDPDGNLVGVNQPFTDDEMEDNGSECVICMVEVRDTLILPCRHLCLCNLCADSLRYQSNSCPICRIPFRALLQIKAVRKQAHPIANQNSNLNLNAHQSLHSSQSPIPQIVQTNNNQTANQSATQPNELDDIQIPPGYVAVSLVEALNGPFIKTHSISSMKNMLIQKNNTNSINETSYSELTELNLTPKSQRSQLSGQLSTNLSNGLNVSFNPAAGKKQKLRKQNSNNSLDQYGSNNLQENESISLNLDEEDNGSIGQNWNIEMATLASANLSAKSSSSFSIQGQETTKLLSKQTTDQISLRKRSPNDTQLRTSITIDTSNIVYPKSLSEQEHDSISKELDSIKINDSKRSDRRTPEIAEDDD